MVVQRCKALQRGGLEQGLVWCGAVRLAQGGGRQGYLGSKA